MHGYAEKSCTKLAPFFPGTVLGLTTKIPQSAEILCLRREFRA